jgi:hypothetical protein
MTEKHQLLAIITKTIASSLPTLHTMAAWFLEYLTTNQLIFAR